MSWEQALLIAVLAGALVLGGLAWWIVRRLRRKEAPVVPAVPPTPPDVEALRALDELAAAREPIRRYDGEIRYMDHHLGRLLAALRDAWRYDPAVIVIVAVCGVLPPWPSITL